MTKEEIKHHINLMDYSYKDNVDFKQIGLKKISWITNKETDTQGYVAINTDTIYIVWRCSSSLNDFLRDSNIRKVKFLKEGELVHVGFLNAFNSIKDYLDKVIENSFRKIGGVDKIKNIVICGHSLGGALSTLTAYHFCEKYPELREKVQKISIGSPRVGNKEYVNSLTFTHYRVQNNCDDVTKVPFRLMGFKHHGTHMYMNYYGAFRNLTPWQQIKDMVRSRVKAYTKGQKFLGVYDHMMDSYIAKLGKLGEN